MSNRTAEIEAAREADTAIAAKWDIYWTINSKLTREENFHDSTLKSLTRMRSTGSTQVADFERHLAKHEANIETFKAEKIAAKEVAQNLDKELYKGWSRFFLVKHIHNTTRCSSFRPTTRVGWLPDVSGLTEAEAVKEHGESLCTICFPSAPVELTRKQVDPSLCAGSGQPYHAEKRTGRERMAFSPQGICSVCEQAVTLTARGSMKVRKHKVS